MIAKRDMIFCQEVKDTWAHHCSFLERQDLLTQVDNLRQLHAYGRYDLVRAFAIVYHSFKRFHPSSFTLYDEQVVCAKRLIAGFVAEMDNGEGKTYAAAVAAAVSLMLKRTPIGARRVYVASQNDYLSHRDAEDIARVYTKLGFSVGLVLESEARSYVPADASGEPITAECPSKDALQKDIVYSTLTELIFTHLRDQVRSMDEQELPVRDYLILDEADGVLLDQARKPHNLSISPKNLSWKSAVADRIVHKLVAGKDFLIDRLSRRIHITEHGYRRIETILRIKNLFIDAQDRPWHWYVRDAIHAHNFCIRGEHYEIQNNLILTYDDNTGRLTENRLHDGLHEAVQAKEGFVSTPPNEPLRTTTPALFIKSFRRVCGLTATAVSVKNELRSLYSLRTVRVPRQLPSRLVVLPTLFTTTRPSRICHTVRLAANAVGMNRPVLINTLNEVDADCVGNLLRFLGYRVSQIKPDEPDSEPNIVASAGRPWRITIAAKLASRGTEIAIAPEIQAAAGGESDGRVVGLFVLGCGISDDSARADSQLAGRTARRGMPGSVQFACDLDDTLFRQLMSTRIRVGLIHLLADESTISHKWIDASLEFAKRQRDWYDRMWRNTQADIETVLERLSHPWFLLQRLLEETEGVEHVAKTIVRFFARTFAHDKTGTGIGVAGDVDLTAVSELLELDTEAFEDYTHLPYGSRAKLVETLSLKTLERYRAELVRGDLHDNFFHIFWDGIDSAWRSYRSTINTTVDRLTLYYQPAPPPAWALERELLESWRREIDYFTVWAYCRVFGKLRESATGEDGHIPELLHWTSASRDDIQRVITGSVDIPSGIDENEDLSNLIKDWNAFAKGASDARGTAEPALDTAGIQSQDFVENAAQYLHNALVDFAKIESPALFLPVVYNLLLAGQRRYPECHLATAHLHDQLGIPLSREMHESITWAKPLIDAAQSDTAERLSSEVALIRLGLLLRSNHLEEAENLLEELAARNEDHSRKILTELQSRCEAYKETVTKDE